MAFHHNFDPKDDRAIFVFDAVKDLADLTVITVGIKILLGFIGLLTLGIGGVGLMNIMLVSVTQRTREIGVEKALGARRWHILFQFLAEALVITAIGGLLGVVLAYLVSWSVGSLTLWSAFIEDASEGDIHLYIDSATLIWSTVILSFVGIVSGMLPAIKAARLNPDRSAALRVASRLSSERIVASRSEATTESKDPFRSTYPPCFTIPPCPKPQPALTAFWLNSASTNILC